MKNSALFPNVIEQAYKLHLDKFSYKEIADKLGISKTRAFEYVKEVKLSNGLFFRRSVPNVSDTNSEQKRNRPGCDQVQFSGIKETNSSNLGPVKIKEFTGDDLLKKKFNRLAFTGKFFELIGNPEKIFSAVIWGLPKGGKSNFAIRFADYLQEYFGKVLYIAAEEGEGVTLQNKLKAIGGSKIIFWDDRNKESIKERLKTDNSNFVFIDSINNAGIDDDFMELLKKENPKKSFIAIAQATKSGNFKGDQSLTHNCDFIIKVEKGIAYHEGRFGPYSQVEIFKEPRYSKKKNEEEANCKDHKSIHDKHYDEATPYLNNFLDNPIVRAGLKLTKKYSAQIKAFESKRKPGDKTE